MVSQLQGYKQHDTKYNQRKVVEAFFTPEGELRGCEIHHLTYIQCLARFDVSYELVGKKVTVWVVSHDRRVDYPIALHLAAAVATGAVKRHSIDTSKLVGFFTRKKKGK